MRTFKGYPYPDPAFYFNGDSDPASLQSGPPRLNFESLKLLNFDFNTVIYADQNPAFHFNADSDPNFPGSYSVQYLYESDIKIKQIK